MDPRHCRWIFGLWLTASATGCYYDRVDADRRCDDTLPRESPDPEDTGSGTDTDPDSGMDSLSENAVDSGDKETDFSCHYIACKTNADCDCTPHTSCPQGGPAFIKNHCLIIDCDPSDPSTCPEGVPCIDATQLSFGEIEMVCFSM